MSEINITPHTENSNAGLLMIIVLTITVLVLGAFTYTNGWFMRNPRVVTPIPSSNMNITLPPVISYPTPNPTPTLDPSTSIQSQGSSSTEIGDY